MRPLLVLILAGLFVAVPHPEGHAARDVVTGAIASETRELLVVEVEQCPICELVRGNIAPAYARTPRATSVPMRFIDVLQLDRSRIKLQEPITIVPTVLFVRDGAEVGRVTGYLGPDNFLEAIRYLIGPGD